MTTLLEKIQNLKQICGIYDDEETSRTTTPSQFKQSKNSNKDHRHAFEETDVNDMDENTTATNNTNKSGKAAQLVNVVTQPTKLIGGIMKSYQLESLQWLLNIHSYSQKHKQQFDTRDPNLYQINAILADEMGLGKTIQTLALLTAVYENFGIKGRHLIVVPKSTLPQWQQEQQKWCPFFNLLVIIGEREERESLMELLKDKMFNIVLTTYDIINIEFRKFQQQQFEYLIMDEGHKLKSQDTIICQNIKHLKTQHKLLLTGTPIQNDLNELWSLLNVLMPYIFDNPEEFVQVLQQDQNVEKLQEILTLFILRREKKDVETLPPKYEYLIKCPMTMLQKRLYKGILLKDSSALREAVQSKNADVGKTSLTNILMQLRKVADHPYLLKGVEPEPYIDGDHLINVCGKMVVLQKLISKIKGRGEKMLIFCQMTSMLNIIEDYLLYTHTSYVRIDGSTDLDDRANNMKHFMKSDSGITAFLLSTRAGSLGLNLTAANHVVIFQQDFNPQVDLQAVGRAYRLLQKNNVFVYRLLSENSVDVRIYERSILKLKLDELIMQSGDYSGQIKKIDQKKSKNHLMDMVAFGSEQLFNDVDQSGDREEKWDYNTPEVQFSDEKLDQLLEAAFEEQKKLDQRVSEKQNKVEEVIKNLGTDGKLEAQDVQGMYEFEGENFKALTEKLMEEKRKSWTYRRVAAEEMDDEEDDTTVVRDYPTDKKFKRSIYFRPDYYLLNEKFYKLQDRVMAEIQGPISQIFNLNQQLTYEAYLTEVRAGPRKDLYVNENLPGLNEKQVTDYQKFLEVNCPLLNCQPITKKEFQLIVQCLTDNDFEEKQIENKIRRVIYDHEFEKYDSAEYTSSPQKQLQYAFGVLPPSTKYKIAAPCDFKDSNEPDYHSSYVLFKSSQPTLQLDEETFITYSKTLFSLNQEAEWAVKIMRAVARRNQLVKKYSATYKLATQSENPLYNMQLPSLQRAVVKGYNELDDRFLILWSNVFGFNHYKQCLQFIKSSKMFANDFWLKSRETGELKERVEKLVKLFIQQNDKNGDKVEVEKIEQ
ncbi:DNA-dependent_ATPase [Hexamita inflata]|uniref:Putative n=1 Tax=Hexamita inflata TaxID=28002 RepID=A0AA86NSQ7_9EUKA|nr:DNA-dependent ATPase [Hexamita inflata]